MAVTAKVFSDGKFRERMLGIVGPQAADKLHRANQISANELEAKVRMAIHRGEPKGGHITDTLEQFPAGQVGVAVSIGNPSMPYPLHLEVGHKARDGSFVPAKSGWYPAIRVTRKKAVNRVKRAEQQAIKAAVAGGVSKVADYG